LETTSQTNLPPFRDILVARSHKQASFTRWGWYAVLGTGAVLVGAVLGLAI
jgi:hypothetical protein